MIIRHNRKLDEQIVRYIRALDKRGYVRASIAELVGVSPSLVSRVCRKEIWANVTKLPNQPPPPIAAPLRLVKRNSSLTETQVNQVRQLAGKAYTQRSIGEM